jgi:hypothetical protein
VAIEIRFVTGRIVDVRTAILFCQDYEGTGFATIRDSGTTKAKDGRKS